MSKKCSCKDDYSSCNSSSDSSIYECKKKCKKSCKKKCCVTTYLNPCNQVCYNPCVIEKPSYPNYTVYNIPVTTTSYTIPTTICNTYSMYVVNPTTSLEINLPLISSLDNCKKRIIYISNISSTETIILNTASGNYINSTSISQTNINVNTTIQLISDTNNCWMLL